MNFLQVMYSRFNHRESLFLVAFAAIFSLIVLICEAYLVHRTNEYFGGGALNRPFAISNWEEYLTYFIFSLFSDLLFYGSLLAFGVVGLRKTSLRFVAQHYLLFSFITVSIVTVIAGKWQIYQYFSDRFDWGVLKELTGGNLFNMIGQVSPAYFVWLLLIPLVLFAFLYVLRLLNRYEFELAIWVPTVKWLRMWTLLWICAVVVHVALINESNLRFGMNSKLSYWVVDSVLSEITDVDFDGYGLFTSPPDTDNFNSAVNPLSVEVPNNGIDENGLAGDLEAKFEHENVFYQGTPTRNVILMVIETFRTDVVNAEIDGEAVMPFLSKLTKEYAYTDQHYSNYGVTARAIQTLLAGKLTYTRNSEFLFNYFKRNNYRTYVVSAQNESWGSTDDITGMSTVDFMYDTRSVDWEGRGMTTWERLHVYSRKLYGSEVNEVAGGVINESAKGQPFFMYMNYQELHYPYYKEKHQLKFINEGRTDPGFFKAENRSDIWIQYANAAYNLDKTIESFVDELKRKDMFENTVIVIAGDHPDSFYENGVLGHAWTLDRYQRQTPLFVINGSGTYEIPLGQDEVVPIIMGSIADGVPGLRFAEKSGKEIFVLSGLLDSPRQIGLLKGDSLLQYDFRNGLITDSAGVSHDFGGVVSQQLAVRSKQLINKWERERYLQSLGAEVAQ